jgi:carnitine O-acetyltransferase
VYELLQVPVSYLISGLRVQLKNRFNAARIPTSPADVPLAYPEDTHHIVVVRNNRYFKVDTKGRGKKELAEAFKHVKRMADGTPGEGVGVLCADDRDVWTEVGSSFSLPRWGE